MGVFLLILFFPLSVFANGLHEKIDAIQKRYQTLNRFSATFTQETFVAILDRKIERSGKIILEKGGQFQIEYLKPEKRFYISDGKTLRVFTPHDPASEVRYNLDNDLLPQEALSFLTGFGNLKKEFHVTISKGLKALHTDEAALHLIPKKQHPHYTALDALFNNHHLLTKLILHSRSGNRTVYSFKLAE